MYGWEQVHADLEADLVAGTYGNCHSAYFGLAEIRANVDLNQFHRKKSPSEFLDERMAEYMAMPNTRRRWKDIVTFDPLGLFASQPTMACTTARMMIPELNLEADPIIVNEDGSINTLKVAIDYAWNIPGLCARLGFDETRVRDHLYKWTQNDRIRDPKYRTYLPSVGGLCVYIFGDVRKLALASTEVAVRVHDACCGSDVFGTDICTCRPYLTYAIEGAVDTAKRGGVGLVAYFQKEGRSLGEVTKYRVYNARKRQEGGDRPEMYFYQTESIAGIRDARFQEMMPDVLLWLGVEKIDYLLSMSNEKYNAITSFGIRVGQRRDLPSELVPAQAHVEITAKVASGYHSEIVDKDLMIGYLKSLPSIRERCDKVYQLALADKCRHFKLNIDKLPACAEFVHSVIMDNYPDVNKIPYHSRWRHFDEPEVDELTSSWRCEKKEKVRRLIDLAFVSVLLDAGAGAQWKYLDAQQREHHRSEGLAIASFAMFKAGLFSSDVAAPHRVNSVGLSQLTLPKLAQGFQINKHNPMIGLEGRFGVLGRLASALEEHPEFFGYEMPRPGNMVDYVLANVNPETNRVSVNVLWQAVIKGLSSIWPGSESAVRSGDMWLYSALKVIGEPGSDLIPFHKLSQWLTYSLLEPLEMLGLKFDDMDLLTGLAEYRNGGLFVDTGVLTLREDVNGVEVHPGSELVVEWRALTVILLDQVAEIIRKKLNLTAEQLPLAKVLQGGTWAAGRVVAKKLRPDTAAPPILVRSDGTVF